jgi:hydroxypyruvate isomerase
MPRFAANLTMLFNEVDFLDRFEAAARSGFEAVEYLFPYAYDKGILQARLAACGLTQVLHNLPAGDWGAGERGIACLPDRAAEFEAGVDRAIEYATALGCSRVNCLAGIKPAALEPHVARRTLIRNLQYAAPRLEAAGITLLIEAINTRDVPNFFLNGTAQALDIMDAVGSGNLFFQFDIYHMHVMGEDVAPAIERLAPRIRHMQLADSPGRHEPGTGQIDYGSLFELIDRVGYTGWIGCEYNPLTSTERSLAWRAALTGPGVRGGRRQPHPPEGGHHAQ